MTSIPEIRTCTDTPLYPGRCTFMISIGHVCVCMYTHLFIVSANEFYIIPVGIYILYIYI